MEYILEFSEMNSPDKSAVCFPGFLGEKSDFSFLSIPYLTIDYFSANKNNSTDAMLLSKDSKELPSFLLDCFKEKKISPKTAIGYSFGGRLLLQTMTMDPTIFEKAVIISSHPGLQTETERSGRLTNDLHWANRFLHDSWEEVIKDWNLQPTLTSLQTPFRQESDFSRKALHRALTNWSLGKQDYLPHKISTLPFTLLWIVGENDHKFVTLAKECAKIAKNIQLEIIPDAGHRVMWEKPSIVDTLIRTYVEQN
jgi:2-succinyl-6-hydroxy-2,4-cyclohexadiene-1-carboxylate synthase